MLDVKCEQEPAERSVELGKRLEPQLAVEEPRDALEVAQTRLTTSREAIGA